MTGGTRGWCRMGQAVTLWWPALRILPQSSDMKPFPMRPVYAAMLPGIVLTLLAAWFIWDVVVAVKPPAAMSTKAAVQTMADLALVPSVAGYMLYLLMERVLAGSDSLGHRTDILLMPFWLGIRMFTFTVLLRVFMLPFDEALVLHGAQVFVVVAVSWACSALLMPVAREFIRQFIAMASVLGQGRR
jgi:hypothetical protein